MKIELNGNTLNIVKGGFLSLEENDIFSIELTEEQVIEWEDFLNRN